MKFALAKEHRDYFQKHGFIEFENFFTDDQILQFNQSIGHALSHRAPKVAFNTAEQLFAHGRDLWRYEESLRKFDSQPRLAQLVADLVDTKPLRLGYDQLFPVPDFEQTFIPNQNQEKPYQRFMQQTVTLENISCLNGVVCGVMICLSRPDDLASPDPIEGVDIFPSKPGHVVFFQPQLSFNLQKIYEHPKQRYYLIVYTQNRSLYCLQPNDPHGHALKQLGYVFNDKLSDKLHPVIYR